jgi:peptidoglycan-associated lipoprotein
MLDARFTRFALAATLCLANTACLATRGRLEREVSAVRAEQAQALAAEVQARRAAETELEARVTQRFEARLAEQMNALRADLAQLRTDFGVRITAMEDTLKFAMPVHFEFNESTVRDADRPVLEKIAAVLQRHYPDAAVTIEGFADPAGSQRYNEELSQRRAEAVLAQLQQYGIGGPNINAVGYGETRLVVPGAWGGAPGAEMNRRVVFAVETRGSPLRVMTMQEDTEGR